MKFNALIFFGTLILAINLMTVSARQSTSHQNLVATDKTSKLTGESALIDIQNSVATYSGNAVYTNQNMLIKGDIISAKRTSDKPANYIDVRGNPANFSRTIESQHHELTANDIRYFENTQLTIASGNVRLVRTTAGESKLDMRGEKLEYPDGIQFILTGSPIAITIERNNSAAMNASADRLEYNLQKDQLELSGNVQIIQTGETIKAEKIIYNLKTEVLQIPKNTEKRFEIIQSKKTKT